MQNAIIHGDCLNVLPTLQASSANFILTDPPYLVNFTARDGRTVPNDDNDAWLTSLHLQKCTACLLMARFASASMAGPVPINF